MSTKTIDQLPVAAALTGVETLGIWQSAATSKVSVSVLAAFVAGGITPGSTTLHGLSDVNVAEGGGINGYVLTWDNGTSKWIATAPSPGVTTLHALSDVNVAEGAGIDGDVLTWDNATSKWIASPPASGGVTSLASAGGTLTVSAPTGGVDVSLNLAHQNTWTAQQDFAANGKTASLCNTAYGLQSAGDFWIGTAHGMDMLGTLTSIKIRTNVAGDTIVFGNSITITANLAGSDTVAIAYLAFSPTDWALSTPPTDIWAALDRLAQACNALGHAP